jgi:epoxide hydrolase-like predicted phosphatase
MSDESPAPLRGRAAIRNVIFDLGGVLVQWRPREIASRFYTDDALRVALQREVLEHPDWLELDRGTLDEAAAAAVFAERLGRPPGEIAALFDHVRESLLPIPESVALLERLGARGLNLYALSNISVPNFGHLRERNRFFDLFKGVVISAEVKLVKPDPGIFRHLGERFAVPFAETVFIDDLPRNVESARRLGLAAILFESAAQCAEDLEGFLGEA